MHEEDTSETVEDERVDDPTWTEPSKDTTEEDSDAEPLPEPSTKRKRGDNNKKKTKAEKLAKCPHCFREFTNLKHHINQQHAQVSISCVLIFFCNR